MKSNLLLISLLFICFNISAQKYEIDTKIKTSNARDTTIIIEGKSFNCSISKSQNIVLKRASKKTGNEYKTSIGRITSEKMQYNGKSYTIFAGRFKKQDRVWILILNKNGNPKILPLKEI